LAGKLGLLAYWRTRHLPDFCTKAHEPVCARIIAKQFNAALLRPLDEGGTEQRWRSSEQS